MGCVVRAYKPRRGRILENGPYKVEVTTMRAVEGRMGRRYEPAQVHVVSGVLVEPVASGAGTAGEDRTSEQALVDDASFYVMGAGRWPGGPHSIVRILEGDAINRDYRYQQSGEAQYYGASPMVAHFRVRIDLLRGEVK